MIRKIRKIAAAACAAASLGAFMLSSCSTQSPTATGARSESAAVNSGIVRIVNPPDSSFINLGDTVGIQALVGDSTGSAWRGTVSFYLNGALVGKAAAVPYTYIWKTSTQGSFAIMAVAKPLSGKADTAASINVTVGIRHYPPMVWISQPMNGDVVFRGDTVKISASAWPVDSSPKGGISRVLFSVNGIPIGVDSITPYECSWINTAVGVFAVTAKAIGFNGDTGISAPDTVTSLEGFIRLSAPRDSQVFQVGDSVIIAAKAGGVRFHTIRNVMVYRNNALIATLTTAPYQYTWKNAAQGDYRIKAIAVDAKGMQDTSNTVRISILRIPPTVYISEPADNAMVKVGSSITISAWAYAPDSGSGSISSVKFYRNGRLLTTDYTAPYSYTWTNAQLGVYTLTAVAANSRGVLGYSNSVKVSVLSKIPTIAVTAPANGDSFPPTAQIPVQTSLTDLSGVKYVAFVIDSQNFAGQDSSVPYTTAITGLTPGYHTISAVAVTRSGVRYSSNPVYIFVKDYVLPSVSMARPTDGSSFTRPQSIALQAAASSVNGPIQYVQFFLETGASGVDTTHPGIDTASQVFLGIDSTSPYAYTWVRPPRGSYTLRASAIDSYGVMGWSQNVRITVR